MNPIFSRFHDQTALVEEGHALWLCACLNAVSDRFDKIEQEKAANDDFWFAEDDWRSFYRPYAVKNGILHIPVKGVLLNDFPYALGNWATGYEYIWQAFKRGVDDSSVRGIALVVNSGGGMVAGNFDLVDRMYALRGKKPVRGFAAEHAYSAAYNIITVADHVTVARTGGVGSIGVVVTHFEFSKMLEANGVTVNIIRSKPDKMEGNPYEALSEGARERMQERTNAFHQQFVAMVARNRGMDAAAVDATNAHTFMAQQAIENGLADEVGALDDAITAFEASFQEGDEQMADISQADHDAAIATATASAKAEGVKEGATEAVARINAIVGSDTGKVRPRAALYAALKTSMSVDEATAFLAELPEEKKEAADAGPGAPAGMLKAAMRGSENPEIEASDPEKPEGKSRAERTLAMVKGS